MPEITRRRTGEFLRKLFFLLAQHPDGMAAQDAIAGVRNEFELSEYEEGDYPSGGNRFERIFRFSTIDCVKAGWMVKQQGQWFITELGKQAYQIHQDPEEFHREAVKLYNKWKAGQVPFAESGNTEIAKEDASARDASITFEQAGEQAWAEIEQHLKNMNPYEFQQIVASLLEAMGYYVSWVAPPGKDGGVDILAWSDRLGTRPPRIKVQVKRMQQAVNVADLRSFMAVLGDDDVGLFVTAGTFTKDAEDEARTQEKRKVTLVNLKRLVGLWVEHYDRLQDEARRRFPLQRIWFLAPEA